MFLYLCVVCASSLCGMAGRGVGEGHSAVGPGNVLPSAYCSVCCGTARCWPGTTSSSTSSPTAPHPQVHNPLAGSDPTDLAAAASALVSDSGGGRAAAGSGTYLLASLLNHSCEPCLELAFPGAWRVCDMFVDEGRKQAGLCKVHVWGLGSVRIGLNTPPPPQAWTARPPSWRLATSPPARSCVCRTWTWPCRTSHGSATWSGATASCAGARAAGRRARRRRQTRRRRRRAGMVAAGVVGVLGEVAVPPAERGGWPRGSGRSVSVRGWRGGGRGNGPSTNPAESLQQSWPVIKSFLRRSCYSGPMCVGVWTEGPRVRSACSVASGGDHLPAFVAGKSERRGTYV